MTTAPDVEVQVRLTEAEEDIEDVVQGLLVAEEALEVAPEVTALPLPLRLFSQHTMLTGLIPPKLTEFQSLPTQLQHL